MGVAVTLSLVFFSAQAGEPQKNLPPIFKNASPKVKSLAADLNLTQEQIDKWNALTQEFKQKAVALQHEHAKAIDAILTPRQREIIKNENRRRTQNTMEGIMERQKQQASEKAVPKQ